VSITLIKVCTYTDAESFKQIPKTVNHLIAYNSINQLLPPLFFLFWTVINAVLLELAFEFIFLFVFWHVIRFKLVQILYWYTFTWVLSSVIACFYFRIYNFYNTIGYHGGCFHGNVFFFFFFFKGNVSIALNLILERKIQSLVWQIHQNLICLSLISIAEMMSIISIPEPWNEFLVSVKPYSARNVSGWFTLALFTFMSILIQLVHKLLFIALPNRMCRSDESSPFFNCIWWRQNHCFKRSTFFYFEKKNKV
jgi:hypothetical protein